MFKKEFLQAIEENAALTTKLLVELERDLEVAKSALKIQIKFVVEQDV